MNEQTEYEENLRDFTAMLTLCAFVMEGKASFDAIPAMSYDLADAFMAERRNRTESGIAAIKPKRKYERRTTD